MTKIWFELENNQKVKIMMSDGKTEHQVGQIFTPTEEGVRDTIQVCGLSEAFDFWGCGLFAKEEVQTKDIQFLFDFKTQAHCVKKENTGLDCCGGEKSSPNEGCYRCYNRPCTCEVKAPSTGLNPYVVKRSFLLTDYLKTLKEAKP